MKQLQIVVCLKQVADPEGPASAFKVNPEEKTVVPAGIPPVINPFDENALEAALRIKDNNDAKVIALSMGEKIAQPVLRKALAAGADELVLLEDPQFKDLDSDSIAYVLSAAIKKIGECDLILTGRQAADWNCGVVGMLLAEMLQISGISLAQKVEVKDDGVLVEKLSGTGYEVVKAPMPALITVSSEIGELRSPNIAAIRDARNKPAVTYSADDLQLEPQKLENKRLFKLAAPDNQRECKFMEGESAQEKGENLAISLKEDRVI